MLKVEGNWLLVAMTIHTTPVYCIHEQDSVQRQYCPPEHKTNKISARNLAMNKLGNRSPMGGPRNAPRQWRDVQVKLTFLVGKREFSNAKKSLKILVLPPSPQPSVWRRLCLQETHHGPSRNSLRP